jgi:hypothetical protein
MSMMKYRALDCNFVFLTIYFQFFRIVSERKYIMPFVVRDFNVMKGIDDSENISTSTTTSRRPPSPFIPQVEMTESGHFDAMEDPVRKKKKKVGLERLVRQDSLFDYGAN